MKGALMKTMIHIHEENLEFHLTNGKISYIFRVMEDTGVLEQLYTGKALRPQPSYNHLLEREVRPSNNLLEGSLLTSLEHVKQEMPVYGTTDFREPGVSIRYEDGDTISHFAYHSHYTMKGKPRLSGMPHTFCNEEEGETLVVELRDRYSKLSLLLSYSILKDHPVLIRHSEIQNLGEEEVTIERLMSISLDLPEGNFDFVHLHGAWAREMQMERKDLGRGITSIGSTRGASSHIHNPFFALLEKDAGEGTGRVYGLSFLYSGDFLGQVEVDSYEVTRAMMGINPRNFSWILKKGEHFTTPEAVLVFSEEGIGGMSRGFHNLFRKHLIRKEWALRKRPLLLNSWEGTYFDFTEEKILSMAKEAKEMDIELFVLDDGWFGNRNSDNSSLGNWKEDPKKLPSGMEGLSKKIRDLGLSFGLWFEPEMVNKDTPLYQEHPEWIIGHPKKNISHGRNQYVLDFSNPDVVEEIFRQMDKILEKSNLAYLKWDMNRYISEGYVEHLGKKHQGELFHRYILGVYRLYEMILEKYPDLLIEACAGGGGRFDPGMLYFSPQIWLSDDTDAVERLKIQYGASLVYPISCLGSHVSQVPNHQVARITSLTMRGDVALFGTSGYELNPMEFTEKEKEEIRIQIAFRNKHQNLLLTGDFYRLSSPFEKNITAWMVVSKDQKEALLGIYEVLASPNKPYRRIRLKGLYAEGVYQIDKGSTRPGDELMEVGILLGENYIGRAQSYWGRTLPGDFHSKVIHLKQV